MSRPTEDELIARFFAPLAGEGGLGLRDDAALLTPPPGDDLVVTVDALVADVHFFRDDPPRSVAAKALGVNLSDLAAKGATPTGFLLALVLPQDWTAAWMDDFAAGLGEAAAEWGCPLLGGDTVRMPGPLTVSITAFGCVPQGRMVRRTTAAPRDLLYVSGSIGDAAFGLKLRLDAAGAVWDVSAQDRAALVDRYLHPRPRIALGGAVRDHANAAMDVSDGLVGDATKMAIASNVAVRIALNLVPLSPAARAVVALDPDALRLAVTGGDDYEILAAVPPARRAAFEAAASVADVAVTCIGEVSAGKPGLTVTGPGGEIVRFSRGSFSHF